MECICVQSCDYGLLVVAEYCERVEVAGLAHKCLKNGCNFHIIISGAGVTGERLLEQHRVET
jgi:hypothetical protein